MRGRNRTRWCHRFHVEVKMAATLTNRLVPLAAGALILAVLVLCFTVCPIVLGWGLVTSTLAALFVGGPVLLAAGGAPSKVVIEDDRAVFHGLIWGRETLQYSQVRKARLLRRDWREGEPPARWTNSPSLHVTMKEEPEELRSWMISGECSKAVFDAIVRALPYIGVIQTTEEAKREMARESHSRKPADEN